MADHRIPRIAAKAAPYFFDEFYLHELPVIITGLVRAWPCYEAWTTDYLNAMVGERRHMFRSEDGTPVAAIVDATSSVRGPITAAVATAYPIASLFPEPEAYSFSSVLVAGQTQTASHHEPTHDFVGVIRGVKRVTLRPPKTTDEGAHVYRETLADGDLVFIPAYWDRDFEDVTGAISVTTQSCAYDG